jgi:hypothetical protein
MILAFICPKCATIVNGEHNKENICRYCNIPRIETDVDIMDVIKNNDVEEKLKQRYCYNNPLYDPELAEKIDKEVNENVRNIHPTVTQSSNVPKCPTCGSTNIKRISTASRAVSIGLFGLLSGKIGKNYECRNCKAKW